MTKLFSFYISLLFIAVMTVPATTKNANDKSLRGEEVSTEVNVVAEDHFQEGLSRELKEDEKFDTCWLQVDENDIDQGTPDELAQRVPWITYNFYKCIGLALVGQSPCECMLSRTVTVPQGDIVGVYFGEYSSLSQCNANCGHGVYDKCSFCDTVQQHVGGGNIVISTVCKHVQDGLNVPYSALFQNNQCFRRCLRLEEAHISKCLVL
jgi:hypothetical protein